MEFLKKNRLIISVFAILIYLIFIGLVFFYWPWLIRKESSQEIKIVNSGIISVIAVLIVPPIILSFLFKNSKGLWSGIIIGFLILLASNNWCIYLNDLVFDEGSKSLKAVIIEKDKNTLVGSRKRKRTRNNYYFTLKYTISGKSFVVKKPIEKEIYSLYDQGDSILVTYASSNPKMIRIEGLKK